MLYIRLLHPNEWQAKENRFNRLAFRSFSKEPGGISIIDPRCAFERSGCVCNHIAEYYIRWNLPTVFWIFDTQYLPAHEIKHTPSLGGDEWCHRDIFGLSDKQADQAFK